MTNPNDFRANFTYDYSTWVPGAGQTGPATIPRSPNSSGIGTRALRFDVNDQDAVDELAGVVVFPNAASNLTRYRISFDLWGSFAGGALGVPVAGLTQFLLVGGHSNGLQVEWPNGNPTTGFHWTAAPNGGAGQDYRYYEGQGAAATRIDARPNWHNVNALNNLDPPWLALLPAPPYKVAGAPGHAWTEIEMIVNGRDVTVNMRPSGAANFTTVATWTISTGVATLGYPFVGYADLFNSIESPLGDTFILIDNLKVIVPLSVGEWEDY